ncbi:hypothetical protein DL93DRAFT_2167123 [Clavulina sp. PMI_390]|nr:hypothetical protein DL93DRAFT_2167123 [Clavulina sp. PMI_390]
MPGKPGMFRIDDDDANKKCTMTERKRRRDTMLRLFKTLGKGLMAYKRAELRGESLQLKRKDGTSRSSRVATPINGASGYRLARLPDGYAVFQARREGKNGELLRYSTYICGSAHVKEFTSAREFVPHLHWLSTGMVEPCVCFQCGGGGTKIRSNTSRPMDTVVNLVSAQRETLAVGASKLILSLKPPSVKSEQLPVACNMGSGH